MCKATLLAKNYSFNYIFFPAFSFAFNNSFFTPKEWLQIWVNVFKSPTLIYLFLHLGENIQVWAILSFNCDSYKVNSLTYIGSLILMQLKFQFSKFLMQYLLE